MQDSKTPAFLTLESHCKQDTRVTLMLQVIVKNIKKYCPCYAHDASAHFMIDNLEMELTILDFAFDDQLSLLDTIFVDPLWSFLLSLSGPTEDVLCFHCIGNV